MRGFLSHQMSKNKLTQTVSMIDKGLSPQGRKENGRHGIFHSTEHSLPVLAKRLCSATLFLLVGFGRGQGSW